MKKLTLSFLVILCTFSLFAQGTETFTKIAAGSSSYSAQAWTGDNGLPWTASKARTDLTITGPAITIDGRTAPEKLECAGIPGGIGNLTFNHRQEFTGSGGTITVKINGNAVGTEIPVSATLSSAELKDINITGSFTLTLEIKAVRVSIDDIVWTAPGSSEPKPEPTEHPLAFSSSSLFATGFTLTWQDAGGTTPPDGYLIKGSSQSLESILDPVDGDSEPVSGLNKVVSQGTGLAPYSGLNPVTTYYFRIYPFTNTGAAIDYKTDGGVQQISVTTPEGSAARPEPSAYPTTFSAPDPSQTSISLLWVDAAGDVLPDGYLVKGSPVGFGAITSPVDGMPEEDSGWIQNITSGVETAVYNGLTASTTYYFKIFPYTNSGAEINFKTDGSIPQISVITAAGGGGQGIPDGYYLTATGTGATLKTNLYTIIKGHTSVSYNSLYSHFVSTDSRPDGSVWDMYSNIKWKHGSKTCGSYSGEGDCYNREHSFPASWFNDASPMYSELFHLYPTDGYVNNRRSNYPFGEVGNATYTSQNGSKLGQNKLSGYSGTVFEPLDEYKGDFARTYFYMVTRYENLVVNWQKNNSSVDAVLNGTTFPAFESWFLNMIYRWHKNDPVSQKEIDRNNAIYGIQKNRNPYIDHPEYVTSVWGGQVVSVEIPEVQIQTRLKIMSAYPNPFNPEMTLRVDVPKDQKVTIRVMNVLGQVVSEESLGFNAGENSWTWKAGISGGMPASGVYYVSVAGESGTAVQPVVLMK
ncbi:MAG: endonuclease [Bacteroidetes bacterium]|nr:endonuclease [Bacteroidota bacterium]